MYLLLKYLKNKTCKSFSIRLHSNKLTFLFSIFFVIILGIFTILSSQFIFNSLSIFSLKKKLVKIQTINENYTTQINNHYVYLSSFLDERFDYYKLQYKKTKIKKKEAIGGKEKKFTEREKKSIFKESVLNKNKSLKNFDSFENYINLVKNNNNNLKKNYSLYHQRVTKDLKKDKNLIVNFPTSMPFLSPDSSRKIVIHKENHFFELLGYKNGTLYDKILILSPGKGNIIKIKKNEDGIYNIIIDHTLGIQSTFKGRLLMKEDIKENSPINKNQVFAEVENGNKIIYKIIVGNKFLDPKNFILEN